MPNEPQDLADMCRSDLDQLHISKDFTMVHCLDGILLIRADEQEVTNMAEVLVSPMCSRGWEGTGGDNAK